MLTELSTYAIWEELIFGDENLQRNVVDEFMDAAEFLGNEDAPVCATTVVENILNRHGEIVIRSMFSDSTGRHCYGFKQELQYTLMHHIDSPIPVGLLEESATYVQEDIPEPDSLPVRWDC